MSGREGTWKSDLIGELANSCFSGELPLRVEDDIEMDETGRRNESASTWEVPLGTAAGEGKD